MNRLDVKDVEKTFHEPDGSKLQILLHIILTIHEKELIIIKGPSGSGKTTLLNILAGLIRPTAGSVYFNGIDISQLNLKQLATYRLNHIGYLFQHWNLFPFLNARENIEIPARLQGLTHSSRIKKVEELDNYLCQMYKEFSSKYPKGSFLIISDHGMANVNKSVDINMEKEFGRAGEDTYLYFIDSTMLRVWTFDTRGKIEIESHLNKLNFGKIVNPEERVRYGIASKKFGNIIFLLNEGAVFNPGFFGRKLPKAMHGYCPELESQKGLVFSNQILNRTEYATTELFTLLKEMLVSSAT